MRHSFGKSLGLGSNWKARWRSETTCLADRGERMVSQRYTDAWGCCEREGRSPWIPEMGSMRWPEAESVFSAPCLRLATLNSSHLVSCTAQGKSGALCTFCLVPSPFSSFTSPPISPSCTFSNSTQ